MNTVELTVGKVELVERLTWGMQEQIRSAMMGGFRVSGLTDKDKQNIEVNGEVLGKMKYKAIELCVKKITLNDGKEIPFTTEWLNDLSIEDGDKLYAAVNEVTNGKKK